MDEREKLSELRFANYEASIDRIGNIVISALENMDKAESNSEALLMLQIGNLQLLSTIARSLASIEWLGISTQEKL